MARCLQKGALIVLEGIDGTGKSTQCRRLVEKLREEGWDVVQLREPTDGPFGRRIREIAVTGREDVTPEQELQLFLDDRRENVRDNILPALQRGAIIVMDRYYYSTIAYQGARELDPALIRARNEEFAPPADLLLHLAMPVEMVSHRVCVQRQGDLDHFEAEPYLRKVKEIFDSMRDPQLVTIDAAQPPDAVFESIYSTVQLFLAGKR